MVQIYGFIWNYQGIFLIIFSDHSKSYNFITKSDSWIYNFISPCLFLFFKQKPYLCTELTSPAYDDRLDTIHLGSYHLA